MLIQEGHTKRYTTTKMNFLHLYHIKNVSFFLFDINCSLFPNYLTEVITGLLRNRKLLKCVLNDRVWNCHATLTPLFKDENFFFMLRWNKNQLITHRCTSTSKLKYIELKAIFAKCGPAGIRRKTFWPLY